MTTAAQAFGAIRARLEASPPHDSAGTPVFFRWQGEDEDSLGRSDLPSVPAPFVYTEFLAEGGAIAGFGGGRGKNLYRNRAVVVCHVFVPRGWGLAEAATIAEAVAMTFRSYRDEHVSCFDATVYPGAARSEIKPPGVESEVTNYYWASVEVSLHYDLIG
jgi:hypothetical protein